MRFLKKIFRSEPLRRCSGQEGFSLASVIFAILILGAIGLSMSPIVSTVSRGSLLELQGQQAFYVADGGLQYIAMRVFDGDTNFTDNGIGPTGSPSGSPPSGGTPISLNPGQFWVQYTNVEVQDVDVTSTGRVGNSVRRIQSHLKRTVFTPYALQSGANTHLDEEGASTGNIVGDVSYGGTFLNDNDRFGITGTVQPGQNPPTVNLQPLIDLTTSNYAGDYTVPAGNTAGNIHATGNVIINNTSGDFTGILVADGSVTVTLTGNRTRRVYGTLAAGGNISFSLGAGSSTLLVEAQLAGGKIQPALAANGNIQFSQDVGVNSTTIRGLIQANGNVSGSIFGNNTTTIEGAVSAGGNIDLASTGSGSFTVNLNAGGPYLQKVINMTNWKEV